MSGWKVFRDDDISVTTDLRLLQEAHEIIVSAGKVHTVAVEMCNLSKNREVWDWLHRTPNLDVQLHGWHHAALDGEPWLDNEGVMRDGLPYDDIVAELRRCLDYWRDVSKRGGYKASPITTLYPPWNRVSDLTRHAAAACGLTVDARHGKGTPVFLFHYWAASEVEALKRAVV